MDQSQHPVSVTIERQERYSRGLALATLLFAIPKTIILIPHFIILWLLGIVAFILAVIAQVVVLITAHYPPKLHHFVLGVLRWQLRTNAYFLGLTDKYPPFSLS